MPKYRPEMIMSIFSLGFRFCERHSERKKRPDCCVGTQAPNVLLQDCGCSFGCSSGPGRKTETSATDKGRVSATTGQLHQSVALSLPPHFGQTLPAHRTGRCLPPNIPTSIPEKGPAGRSSLRRSNPITSKHVSTCVNHSCHPMPMSQKLLSIRLVDSLCSGQPSDLGDLSWLLCQRSWNVSGFWLVKLSVMLKAFSQEASGYFLVYHKPSPSEVSQHLSYAYHQGRRASSCWAGDHMMVETWLLRMTSTTGMGWVSDTKIAQPQRSFRKTKCTCHATPSFLVKSTLSHFIHFFILFLGVWICSIPVAFDRSTELTNHVHSIPSAYYWTLPQNRWCIGPFIIWGPIITGEWSGDLDWLGYN